MAQVAQKVLGRNTDGKSQKNRVRVRNWTFTLNNYTPEEIKDLAQQECYLFQEETGENGTPHLQGMLCFPNPMSLSSMKKVNGRAHWEPCRNKIASIQYCSKEKTRTGKIYCNFDYLKHVVHVAPAQVADFHEPENFRKFIESMVNDTTCDDLVLGQGGIYRLANRHYGPGPEAPHANR